MNEADDRMRRQAEPAIGVSIFDLREDIGIARRRGVDGLPSRRKHAQAQQQPEAERPQRVAQQPHQYREQDVRRSVDEVPQARSRALTGDRAIDVDAAVGEQHDAGDDHQAAERKRGLK